MVEILFIMPFKSFHSVCCCRCSVSPFLSALILIVTFEQQIINLLLGFFFLLCKHVLVRNIAEIVLTVALSNRQPINQMLCYMFCKHVFISDIAEILLAVTFSNNYSINLSIVVVSFLPFSTIDY